MVRSVGFALIVACVSQIADAQPETGGEVETLVAQARALIDSWSGQRATLSAAAELLREALEKDPSSGQAYVELARATIKAGYLRSVGGEALFADGTLDAAQNLLDKALDTDRANGGAYVLYGHLATLQGRYDVARDMLTQADTLAVDDPWRNLNWADLLLRTGDVAGAVAQYESVLASDTENLDALKAAHAGLRNYYWAQGNLEKVEETYVAEIELEPDSAWAHGNYAGFLLSFKPGDPDEALGHAERAIELMPYPLGWRIYVAALCAKYAEVANRDPEAGAKYLARAQEIEASACSGEPR